ncbi:DUF4493 domain-containing protein [uncultured Alistipes sp.]|uniref:DUF4493 domain-containing protein n=1 Tax=uncultured Alistipes sp. TaxID=538949 RepID=UPI00272CA25A|nr:DUF4493 domain-containing protein [uncultured Alistipes sp.]
MKMDIRKYFTWALAAGALLAASCVEETSRFEGGEEKPDPNNVGYLSFSELNVTVEERMDDVGNTPEARAATRAGNTDFATYRVEILDAAGNAVEVTDKNGTACKSFLYADRPQQIELPAGSYTLSISSGPTKDAAFEGDEGTPTYGASPKFAITKGNTTALTDVVCRLLSVKVTVAYKDTLVATMSEKTRAELVLGDKNALTFEGREPALAGFLKPLAGQKNPLVLYLTTKFNGKEITEQPLTVADDAKAGEWRKITVGLQHAEDGSVVINAEIETWVYNEEVVVDTRTLATFCEDRIPDEDGPDAPKLTWPGHSLDEVLKLTPDNYDENGYFTEPCEFTITTKDPMASLVIDITTDNPEFRTLLDAKELTEPKDMFTVQGLALTALRSWGFPAKNLAVTERTFPLDVLMKILSDYEGTHAFAMTIVDEAGRKSTSTLTIEVSAGGGDPRIVWVGHDIKKRYNTSELQDPGSVQIRISATQGVRSLTVAISGALDLDGMVPSKFDLADPEATEAGLSEKLKNLGFPVGAEVTGQTALSFDITSFMALMGTFPGDTDFEMTVVDSTGVETAEKVMVHVD